MVISAKTQMAQRNACMPCLYARDHYSDAGSDAQRFAKRRRKRNEKRRIGSVICAYDGGGKISPTTSTSNTSSVSSSSSASDFNLRSKSRGVMGQFFRYAGEFSGFIMMIFKFQISYFKRMCF